MLDAWIRHYPVDVFPTIWKQMDGAATSGIVVVSDEVLRELERKDDGAHKWVKQRKKMIVPLDAEVEAYAKEVLGRYPRLVDTRKSRSGADPFVIAVAMAKKGSVVTAELRSGNLARPKIPDVCDELRIECVNVVEFFRSQKWRV